MSDMLPIRIRYKTALLHHVTRVNVQSCRSFRFEFLRIPRIFFAVYHILSRLQELLPTKPRIYVLRYPSAPPMYIRITHMCRQCYLLPNK